MSFVFGWHRNSTSVMLPAILPAWLSGLPGVALIIIAPTATAAAFAATTSAVGASAAPTTTKASAASTTGAKAASTAASAGTVRLRLRLIDLQRSSAQFGSVQGGNGLFGFAGVSHFNERKAARAASFPVGDQADLFDCSVSLEKAAELGFGGAVRQIANVKVLHCVLSLTI